MSFVYKLLGVCVDLLTYFGVVDKGTEVKNRLKIVLLFLASAIAHIKLTGDEDNAQFIITKTLRSKNTQPSNRRMSV